MQRDRRKEIAEERAHHLETFQEWVEEVLLPDLGSSGPASVQPAERGRRSLVYMIEADGLPRMVLRGEPDRIRVRRRVRGHRALIRHGVSAPAILRFDLDAATFRRLGFFPVIEEHLKGRHFDKVWNAETAAAALGEALACAHRVTALAPGWPGELRHFWKNRYRLKAKAAGWIEQHCKQQELPGEAFENWLESFPESDFRHRPRLTVGNITPSNMLVRQRRIGFFDLNGVRFGSAPMEMARARSFLAKETLGAFEETYRNGATADLVDEVERSRELCDGLTHLRQSVRTSFAKRKTRTAHITRFHELVNRRMARFQE